MNVAIVGGGLTGMSAAEELARRGIASTIYEREPILGGIAGSFEVGGTQLERFYHHLFTSDTAMVAMIERLGLSDKLEWLPTTNSYFAGRTYRVSTPIDLLKFSYLSLFDRFRLGMMYLRTLLVRDWRPLEGVTARDWIIRMSGERVYDAFWSPLLRSKFGDHADEIAAVWIWNKLKLRGSSRGSKQEERLGYVREGFGQVLDALEAKLRASEVTIRLSAPVSEIALNGEKATGVVVKGQFHPHDAVLVTTAPQILAGIATALPEDYVKRLQAIEYLANVCLVLEFDRRLSDTYWLNIGEPDIPFTGIIEHTNMQRPEIYGGAHLVYISRYLDMQNPFYRLSADEILDVYLPYLERIYPGFSRDWVRRTWAWRARYTQPVIGLHYSQHRLPFATPVPNLWLSCMAQVYPQDRGMNYAVDYGRRVVEEMAPALG